MFFGYWLLAAFEGLNSLIDETFGTAKARFTDDLTRHDESAQHQPEALTVRIDDDDPSSPKNA